MKVILTRDVKGIGRAHEAIEASDGHALNFLIPKRMAIPATASALKTAESRQKLVSAQKELGAKLVSERIAALAEGGVTISKKANEKGHLYDAVDADEIALAAQLPVEAISLEKPLKELGTFVISVALGDQFGQFSITIAAE